VAGKLWKVKRGKKLIGSWHFTAAGGERINTHTSDADAALRFRAKWLKDKAAAPKTEVQGAAAATIAALDGPADLPPPSEPPPAAPPVPPAGDAPPAPQPIAPDGYAPPPTSADWTQDAARAAAASSATDAPAAPGFDARFLDDILADAGALAVELQIALQAWAMARGVKLKAAIVPADNPGRQKGAEIWVKQFRLWLPSDVDLPGWIAAPLVVAATTVPAQLHGATPIPKDEQTTDAAQPTPEAQSSGA
jgi:hypothetical protein